jgi:hypothetical protein
MGENGRSMRGLIAGRRQPGREEEGPTSIPPITSCFPDVPSAPSCDFVLTGWVFRGFPRRILPARSFPRPLNGDTIN